MSGRRNHSAFGHERERKVARLLEDDGWVVFRSSGSFGCCDLVALRERDLSLESYDFTEGLDSVADAQMIEVKGTARSPWVAWGPAERDELRAAARKAGATPMLAWWPPRTPAPQWITEAEWPTTERSTA